MPDQWCARAQTYAGHIRLVDVGIAGATFGVVGSGYLEWIPPEDAGCVDWSHMTPNLDVGKGVIMEFRLLRAQPGALLWVLDGDPTRRGRLYEVASDGLARYVSGDYWSTHQEHFRQVWPNVMPVSWAQIADFQQRGLVGPDLSP